MKGCLSSVNFSIIPNGGNCEGKLYLLLRGGETGISCLLFSSRQWTVILINWFNIFVTEEFWWWLWWKGRDDCWKVLKGIMVGKIGLMVTTCIYNLPTALWFSTEQGRRRRKFDDSSSPSFSKVRLIFAETSIGINVHDQWFTGFGFLFQLLLTNFYPILVSCWCNFVHMIVFINSLPR